MSNVSDSCRRVERLTMEEASGAGLNRSQREVIAAHLTDCSHCRAEASVARLIRDVGDHGAAAPLDEVTERRLLNGIMDKYETAQVHASTGSAAGSGAEAKPAKVRLRLQGRLALVAAAALLALVGAGVGIGVYRFLQGKQTLEGPRSVSGPGSAARVQLSSGQVVLNDRPAAVGQAVLAGQTLHVYQGRTALALPADSAVMLENDSAVKLDRLTGTATALTLQRGSLLASVRPRPGRPKFTVQTRAGRIEVTGTVFWVESTPERVVVAVLRGQVRVVEPDQPVRVVKSGQRLVLGARALGPGTRSGMSTGTGTGSGSSAALQPQAIGATNELEAWRWVRALELVSISGASAVHLRSQPAGAMVRVDELTLGETPLTARLSPGHHRLELRKPGYAPVVQWISVPAGKPLVREIKLRSMLASSSLRPHAAPGDGSGNDGSSKKRGRWSRPRPPWASGGSTTGSTSPGPDGSEPGKATPTNGGEKRAALPPTAKALATRARALRAKGNFKGAVQAFRELLHRYPGHRRAHTARVSLGLVLLDDLKDARGALQQFTRYLAVSRLGALAQEAAYGRIRALRRLGRSGAEIRRLQQFLQHFPQAVQTSAVRRRLRTLGVAVKKPPKDQMGLGGMGGVK